MLPLRFAAVAALLLATSACAAGAPAAAEPAEPAPPSLVASLPESVGSFDYEGYRYFGDESGGFSIRYGNARKRRVADVYVYPVSPENAELGHERLVMGSTRATMRAIGEAVRQGTYSNFAVLTAATRARGVRTVARVQATYLRQNLASYTLLYQSEHDGTLMKIRVSMPDNDANRANAEWDLFAERLFGLIIADLKGAAA